MRRIWLQKIDTGDTWDLLPQDEFGKFDPKVQGSPLLNIGGMGYTQQITQNQIETEYVITKILSKNSAVTGTMYFDSDRRVTEFQKFIGDFTKQFYLFYSPSGRFRAGDKINAPFYKRVVITQVSKTEKDRFGDYVCNIQIATQDDLWLRDIAFYVDGVSLVGGSLVYPYVYPYAYGGRDVLAIEMDNSFRDTSCRISIKNESGNNLSDIEWFIDRDYINENGELVEHADVQRSKWNLTLSNHSELIVDSGALTQEAIVKYNDGTTQNVISLQEPSWEYINFVRIPHGKSRAVFYVGNENINISLTYKEKRELI